jgi:hypothetical protein
LSNDKRAMESARDLNSREIEIVQVTATQVKNELTGQNAEPAEQWTDLVGKSRLGMMEILWDSGETSSVRWANRFYSSCMRYILRRRGHLLHEKCRDRVKDQAATFATFLNMAVDELAKSGCQHGYRLYARIAGKEHILITIDMHTNWQNSLQQMAIQQTKSSTVINS